MQVLLKRAAYLSAGGSHDGRGKFADSKLFPRSLDGIPVEIPDRFRPFLPADAVVVEDSTPDAEQYVDERRTVDIDRAAGEAMQVAMDTAIENVKRGPGRPRKADK